MILGLAITHPEELRSFRWLKIALSFPIVLLLVSVFRELNVLSGFFGLWGIPLLALIWKSPFAHFASLCVGRLITGDLNQPTGIQANFAGAKALRQHRDLQEALHHTRAELEKDPFNYEGLLLLSEIQEELSSLDQSIHPLGKLLTKPGLTAEQRNHVLKRKGLLEERILVEELNAR
ncbi:MAG TPA: hypothetical protein VK633_08155 [Verrucomicrobiae bacterium]|nr:hypothetical protein [Verrucomicrobiae bacterium]